MKKTLILLLFFVAWPSGAQTAQKLPELELTYRNVKQKGDPKATADAAVPVAVAHLQAKNFKRSLDYLLVAKSIYKAANDTKGLAGLCALFAENYYKTGNSKRYNDYIALGAQLIGNDTLSDEYLKLLEVRIGYYKARKKNKQAQYLERQKAQLLAQKQAPAVPAPVEIPAKNVAKPAASPAQATPQRVIRSQPQRKNTVKALPSIPSENVLLLSVSIGIVSFAGLIFFIYRDHRRKMVYRANTEALQSKLLNNLSKALAETTTDAHNKLSLSEQLAQLSRLKSGDAVPVFERENVMEIVHLAAVPFMQHAAMHRISVISNLAQKNDTHPVDKRSLQTICNLLFSDAIRHTQAGDSVYFSATTEKNRLHLRLSYPRGPLTKKEAKVLLDGLYAYDGNRQNAVGFALVKALVEWLGGKTETALDGNLLRIVVKMPLMGEIKRAPKQVPAVVL